MGCMYRPECYHVWIVPTLLYSTFFTCYVLKRNPTPHHTNYLLKKPRKIPCLRGSPAYYYYMETTIATNEQGQKMTAIITQTIDANNNILTELAIKSDTGNYLSTTYPDSIESALSMVESNPRIVSIEFETI